jgi:uncharacterized protein with GYD domain
VILKRELLPSEPAKSRSLAGVQHEADLGHLRPAVRWHMPNFLIQVAYSREGWEALVRNPQNRIEAVRPSIEKFGGKIEHAWFAFGEHDVLLVVDMPNNVNAAAVAMAFAGGGACKTVHTTPLLSVEEAVQAMKKASESGYKPATVPGVRAA